MKILPLNSEKKRHYFWRMIRFSPLLYGLSFIFSLAYYGLPLLIGLIIREFFNALTGETAVRFDLWTLVILFLVTRLTIQIFEQSYAATYAYFEGKLQTLIRRNLFKSLLQDADIHSVQNPGEIINRFDDDTQGAIAPITIVIELSGHALSALIALVVLLRVNAFITLFAFLPMIAIGAPDKRVRTAHSNVSTHEPRSHRACHWFSRRTFRGSTGDQGSKHRGECCWSF